MDRTLINNLVNQLGLDKKDINLILEKDKKTIEQPPLSIGPYIYRGTHYGTISIKDF